jgi:hypothetical protein
LQFRNILILEMIVELAVCLHHRISRAGEFERAGTHLNAYTQVSLPFRRVFLKLEFLKLVAFLVIQNFQNMVFVL